jgi:uncharacterized protein YbjT (DUF2867 family)
MLRQHNALVTRNSPDMNPHPLRTSPLHAGPTPAPHWHLAGATGLIGRALCTQLLGGQAGPEGGLGGPALHLWVRRPLPAGHPAGRKPSGAAAPTAVQVHGVDFAALPPLPPATPNDRAISALGTTLAVAGSEAAFRGVDFDAVLAFAGAARRAGIRRFAAVSALGADARSRGFYNRVKGEAEEALRALGFETLVIARPSLLAGDRASLQQQPRRGEALALALTRPLARCLPRAIRPIEADTVARALIHALGTSGPGVHVLDNAELQRLGQA